MGNNHSPFVLQAMWILGPEEILKLSNVLHSEGEIVLKRAAGEDLVSWSSGSVQRKKPQEESDQDGKILPFSRPGTLFPNLTEEGKAAEEDATLLSSELILLQREISRENVAQTHKSEAHSGYRKSTEMYIVKTTNLEGKEKIRFASTNGVLVNKKQA